MPFSQALLLAEEARAHAATEISLMRLAVWGEPKDVTRVIADLRGISPTEAAGVENVVLLR